MVKHIVMWNIKEELNKEEIFVQLKKKLESLVNDIECLNKIEVGFNFNETESAHDVVLYSEFNTKEDLDAYIIHPAHIEVGKYVKEVVKDRVVVDYLI